MPAHPRFFSVALIAVLAAPSVFAATPNPATKAILASSVRMGASLAAADALCNGKNVATTRASVKAKVRPRALADGMSGAEFDTTFDAAFAATQHQFERASAAVRKQKCGELKALEAQAKAEAARMGASPSSKR